MSTNQPPTDRPAFEDACAQAVQTATGMPAEGPGGAWQGVHETCDRIDAHGLNWDAYSASQGAFCRAGSDAIKIPQTSLDVLATACQAINEKYLQPATAPRPTPEDVLAVKAKYCNQTDSRGQVIYGPSYPAAIALGWADEWFEKERQQGNTHIILGPFDPGKAYPEHFPGEFPNEPENPDNRDPQKLRELVLKILNTPSASGRGFVPILFLDGGGPDPKERIDRFWQGWGQALADLQAFIVIVPGWEPVGPGGAWTTTDMSYALEKAHECFPEAVIMVHTPPERGSFASWPPETDPIWHGDESACWKTNGGQHAKAHLYQTQHAPDVYEPTTCNCAKWPEKWGHQDSNELCAGNRCEDSVARSGAGHNGWRVLEGGVVFMESTAMEDYVKFKNLEFKNYVSPTAEHIRGLMKERVYAKWGVAFRYGQ